jgi:hypothetical protein
MQITERSRLGLAQYRQGSTSVRLLQVEQNIIRSFTSRSAPAKNMERQPLGAFMPDAGKALEFIDQPCNRFGIIKHLVFADLRSTFDRGSHKAGREHSAQLSLQGFFNLAVSFIQGGHGQVLDHFSVTVFYEVRRDR